MIKTIILKINMSYNTITTIASINNKTVKNLNERNEGFELK